MVFRRFDRTWQESLDSLLTTHPPLREIQPDIITSGRSIGAAFFARVEAS
jgi:hypothetical protein